MKPTGKKRKFYLKLFILPTLLKSKHKINPLWNKANTMNIHDALTV